MTEASSRPGEYIFANGEMADQIRHFDWGKTALQSIDAWPSTLLTLVNQILDSSFAMFIFWGEDKIQFYNDAYLQILGTDENSKHPKALGQKGEECWQEIWPVISPLIEQVITTRNPVFLKDQLIPIYRKGKLDDVYWTFSYNPIRDHKGRTAGILVICSETTDKVLFEKELSQRNIDLSASNGKLISSNEDLAISVDHLTFSQDNLRSLNIKMEIHSQQLAESESRFRRLVNEAPVAIFVLKGPDMVFETVNDMMYRMLGKGSEIIGKSYAEAVPELIGQPFFDILDNVFTSGETFYGNEIKATLEIDNELTDGYFNFIYQALRNEQEEISGIMCVAANVIDQVNARRAIVESGERFEIAIDAGNFGTTEVDLATGKMVFNDRFKEIFGRDKDEEFTYSDMFKAMLPEYREDVRKRSVKAQEDHSLYEAIYQISWPDGSLHWIEAHGRGRYDEHGTADRMVGIIADVTEQKANEQRKNDFIGMVSHELKTPITSLNAYLQMLHGKAERADDKFTTNALERSVVQVKKMTTMINGFLNVSRLESGKIHINLQLFDMARLVKETELESMTTITSHKIVFAPVAEIFVKADEDKIANVINNLVSNAVKYSPSGSTIHIACVTIGKNVQVSVKDEGSGIAPKDINKLFDRYYRTESASSSSTSGFGIGLYLSAEIIQRHSGRIWVESELGEGSTFYFSIPISNK